MRSKRPFTTIAILLISLAAPALARGAEPLCDWLGALGEAAGRAAAGDLEGRQAAAQRALAARPRGPASALAHLAVAAAHLSAGRGVEALPHLEPAQALATPGLRGWLQLSRGEALLSAGRAAEAASELGRAAAHRDGPSARRAGWLEGRALLDAGRPGLAVVRLEALLRQAPLTAEARRGALDLAEADQQLGRADAALRRWRNLALEAPDGPEGQAALEALARRASQAGAPPAARLTGLERLLRAERLLARGRASEAWSETDAAAAAAPPAPGPRLQLLRALIRAGEGRLTDAEALARPLQRAGVPPGVRRGADLILARVAGRAGRAEEASRLFLRAAAGHDPVPGLGEGRNRELAEEAAFLAAWIWLDAGDRPRAVARLDAFARTHRTAHRSDAARWFAAWARLRQGDAAGARRALAALGGTSYADAARYWSARLEPDPTQADRLLGQIDGRGDDGWYLALARARLRNRGSSPAVPAPPPLEPLALPTGPAADRLAAGAALLALGWPEAARAELEEAVRLAPSSPTAGPVAELAAFAGDVELAYRVSRDQLGITRRTLRWLHPSPRPAALEAAAAAAALDADLLRAVVRRESAFRQEARSAAGAEGLAQLLPSTARRLGALTGLAPAGLPSAGPLRLADPDVSIGLGAHYLGLLSDRLGGEAVALAGYNAGPAPAAAWALARSGQPLDEWVESIPYRETRAYVKGVLAARETYRRLAGLGPSLDPDRPTPPPRDGVAF